jgi:hypothetical protein
MYWHTYDVLADSDKGIPSKYIFKGMPKDVFEVEPKQVKRFQQDTRYGRVISKYGTWLRPLPEMPEEGIVLPCPHYYGYFLDIAYPDWATTREDFGVSDAIAVHKTKTCGDLC